MKKYIVIIILLLSAQSLIAQNIKISGTVVDSQSGAPVPFANAALFNTSDTSLVGGASADLDGRFMIRNVRRGTYLMRCSSVGYDYWEQIAICTSDVDMGRIPLHQGATLSAVTVTASRSIFSMDGEKNIYSTMDDPSIQNGTVIDALQNAPGIEVDAEGNIKLRGVQQVDIWINNRPSRMNSEALKQYLKSLPAKSLKRIEVVTNPSARYGGGNPVVNIVTKSKTVENQFLSVGANANTKPELLPWLSYILKNEHWDVDVYANAGYQNDVTSYTGNSVLLTSIRDTSRTDSFRRTLSSRSINAFASADVAYHFDSLNTLYLWGSAFPAWAEWSLGSSTSRNERIYMPGDWSFVEKRSKPMEHPSTGLEDGIWYEHLFDDSTGHAFGFGYYGGLWLRDSLLNTNRCYNSPSRQDVEYREHNGGSDQFHCFEIFYTLPFGPADTATGIAANELEAGGEGSYEVGNKLVAADSLHNGEYLPFSLLSSQTLLRSESAALYVNLTHRWRSLSLKCGFRGEIRSGRCSYHDAPEHSYRFFTPVAVPSVHATYTTPGQSIFSLSYTRRMETPQGADYSTRRFYTLDGYSVGNPLLKVGSSNHLEVKWDRYFDGLGAVGVNLFYSAKTDQQGTLDDVAFEDAVFHRLVTFSQPVNIGSSWNSGMDLHLTYRPNAFLNVRFYGSLFYDYLDMQLRPTDDPYRSGMWCYTFRLNAWAKLWNRIQLFGNIYYNSPSQSLLNTMLSRKAVDVGVNADFFHQRLSVCLGANDIFGWNSRSTISNNPYLAGDLETELQSRYLTFGITFRFGQMELEKVPQRSRRHRDSADNNFENEE